MNSFFKMWALWFNPVEWSTKDRTRDFSGSSILPYKIINGHAMPIILHNKFLDFLFGSLSLWDKSCSFTDNGLTPWTLGMEFLDWKGPLCVRLLLRNYTGRGLSLWGKSCGKRGITGWVSCSVLLFHESRDWIFLLV